jgi:hypothetical protein
MAASQSPTVELLRLDSLQDALRSPGPCVTLLVPPYRPGEIAGSPCAQLKGAIKVIAEHSFPPAMKATLLEPLERLAESHAFASGCHLSRVILRSRDVFEQFYVRQPVQASITIGGCFWIRKLVGELAIPSRFYILALSKTGVALWQRDEFTIELKHLPGVPDTVSDALALEPPDHDLENRATAGNSRGGLHRIRFGTGSGREQEHAHLADYYKLVDNGLQEIVHKSSIPVILAGVEEDVALYRTVSCLLNLAPDTIPGSPDIAHDPSGTLLCAYTILWNWQYELQKRELQTFIERVAPHKISNDSKAILEAAFKGQVGQLYVNETAASAAICVFR